MTALDINCGLLLLVNLIVSLCPETATIPAYTTVQFLTIQQPLPFLQPGKASPSLDSPLPLPFTHPPTQHFWTFTNGHYFNGLKQKKDIYTE